MTISLLVAAPMATLGSYCGHHHCSSLSTSTLFPFSTSSLSLFNTVVDIRHVRAGAFSSRASVEIRGSFLIHYDVLNF